MSDVEVALAPICDEKPRKMPVSTSLDKFPIREAYEDVRSDVTDTNWVVMKFEGSEITVTATGEDFDEFKGHFTDDERGFGYIRLLLGDEMSKRRKFLFLTWIGPEVGVLKRAKMSCDKAIIKEVINSFAAELQAETQADLDMALFRETLEKAGGANYGTGVRDN